MKKISAIIITFNEEKKIENTLKSVQWCDEIIIIDSGSSDNTLNICKKYTSEIFFKQFNGFGEQKQFAVSKTNNDWILSIDSDEIVSEKLKNEIISIPENNICNAYSMPISLFFLNKKLKFGNSYCKKKVRLFNKKYCNFNSLKVHESINLNNNKTHNLKNELLHYSYTSVFEYFKKFNLYTEIAAKELYNKKKKTFKFYPVIRFPFEFIKRYFFNFGFLDGYQGFLWCFFSAFYSAIKYIKLIEKYNGSSTSKKPKKSLKTH